MTWDKTVRQIVHESYTTGAWDALRAVLDASDNEVGHECQALEFARRLFNDPKTFDQFVSDSQAQRETR